MKLHADNLPTALNTVSAYGLETETQRHFLEINGVRQFQSLIIHPTLAPIILPDLKKIEDLNPSHFAQLSTLKPDVVIFGTGLVQRFVHPKLMADLINQRIGVECMEWRAACRTYNILMAEGREVCGLFLIETV